jgi:polyvinyl alcohol dehydrogenase (cytochrome)
LDFKSRIGRGGVLGGVHFGIAADSGRLYVPINDGPNDPETDHPRSPGIYALDVATGEPIWSAPSPDACEGRPLCEPGYTAAITATPDMVLAGAADGHLRIFAAATSEVLWDFDTAREFASVNGAPANGGSMSGGAAPILYDGNLIVSSGYAFLGKMPGNVLLVFGLE